MSNRKPKQPADVVATVFGWVDPSKGELLVAIKNLPDAVYWDRRSNTFGDQTIIAQVEPAEPVVDETVVVTPEVVATPEPVVDPVPEVVADPEPVVEPEVVVEPVAEVKEDAKPAKSNKSGKKAK